MRAALILERNGSRELSVQDLPEPVPEAGEVIVHVKAAGLNRADLALNANHRQNTRKQQHPISGQEFAGEIVALGAQAGRWRPGARVMGTTAGAHAEYCRIDHRLLMPVPGDLAWDQAAALPVALQTMHDALITNGRLQPGQSVLLHGASSGVGILGLQIARWRGAAVVLGSSRDDGKLADLQRFGMDRGVNTARPDWPQQVLDATGGKGVDLVVDMVAGSTVNGSMRAAAVLGRIVNVGRLGGMTGEFDFDLHALKRLSYVGVTFRTRSDEEIERIIQAALADLGEEIAAGRISLPVVQRFPLEQIAGAHDAMRADRHLGKIVLTP